jgi:parallel beta-helix repeat protein
MAALFLMHSDKSDRLRIDIIAPQPRESLLRRSAMKPVLQTLMALLTLVIDPLPCSAVTIHVPSGQPTIQAGIDAASAGDTVLVDCGTYYEHDIIMKSGVYLTSDTGRADCVTVDAQQQGRVFYCDGVDATTSIVGFTITGGLATGSWPDFVGGGMYCLSSSPTLADCTFSNNQATINGGGMNCSGSSSPTLTGCAFSGNQAVEGGGVYCGHSSSPTLTGCTFSGNQAEEGGGMYYWDSSPTLTDCTFSGNQATFNGGGMVCSSSSPTLTNCTFSANAATNGGGMICSGSSFPTLAGCTLSGNQADYGGGMSCANSSSPRLTNCIIAFSPAGGAVHRFGEDSTPLMECCDIYGNAGGDWVGCIADQYGVDGNFSADPLFCDMTSGDFTLASNSPCLPDGNDCHVLVGAHGEGCEESPVEMTSWGSIKAMYK